jgi:hypothetical protein
MKSAISMIVTGAFSGPLNGALTGWKLTISSPATGPGTQGKTDIARRKSSAILFCMVTPFRKNYFTVSFYRLSSNTKH